MNDKHFVCFDFETGGKNAKACEILQIGAVVIHPRKLEIIDRFCSYLQPLEPDKVEPEALQVTGIKLEEVLKAPHPKLVWEQFTSFIQKYNFSTNKGAYSAPIPMGYNIINYDMKLVDRYCALYGPIDKKNGEQCLFNQLDKFDVLDEIFKWTENTDVPQGTNSRQSKKLTDVCKWLGLDTEGAHEAMKDVENTAKIGLRMLKWYRLKFEKMEFEGAFKRG